MEEFAAAVVLSNPDSRLIELARVILEATAKVEVRPMRDLVTMTPENIKKLPLEAFPSEDEISQWDNVRERIRIGDIKDRLIVQGNDAKAGRGIFIKLKLRPGVYTNKGIVKSIGTDGVHFTNNNGNEKFIPFGSKLIGGASSFSSIKKITKAEWESNQESLAKSIQDWNKSKKID